MRPNPSNGEVSDSMRLKARVPVQPTRAIGSEFDGMPPPSAELVGASFTNTAMTSLS